MDLPSKRRSSLGKLHLRILLMVVMLFLAELRQVDIGRDTTAQASTFD